LIISKISIFTVSIARGFELFILVLVDSSAVLYLKLSLGFVGAKTRSNRCCSLPCLRQVVSEFRLLSDNMRRRIARPFTRIVTVEGRSVLLTQP